MNPPTQATLSSLTDGQVYFGLDWVLETFNDRPADRLTLWDALWHEWRRRQELHLTEKPANGERNRE